MDNHHNIVQKPNIVQKQSLLTFLGPKKSFFLGIVGAVLVGGTVGFFVLLFSGDSTASTSTNVNKAFVGTTNTASTNTVPTQPSGSADVQPSQQVSISPVTSEDHIRGDIEKASVVIVEFSDTECPFCKRFHPTMQQVVEEYGDQVAWVYRHFPLDALHSKARKEAEATECANELGGNDGFWAYIDRLYEVTPSNDGLSASQLPEIAGEVGLDTAKFQDCLDSGKYADKIETHLKDAMASGGNGTPYSVAISSDGETVPISGAQPFSSVKSIIDSLL